MLIESSLNNEFRARRLTKADAQAFARITGCNFAEASQRLVDLGIEGDLIAQHRNSFPLSRWDYHGMRHGMSRIVAAETILKEYLYK